MASGRAPTVSSVLVLVRRVLRCLFGRRDRRIEWGALSNTELDRRLRGQR